MKKENKTLLKLTAKQILLYSVDFSVGLFTVFDKRKIYRKLIKEYWRWRDINRIKFAQDICRLKKQKLINIYKDGKKRYIELTPKGIEQIKKYSINEIKIKIPKIWDKKWRIVIFDIPDVKHKTRNILRDRLKRLGFILLQKSVFIFPFECKREIDYIAEIYNLKSYLKYIVADILEGDQDLIEEFLNQDILIPNMIKAGRK